MTWFDDLPEELQSAPYFKPPESGEQRTIEQVLSDLGNAAQLQGNLATSHLRIPPEDAAAEDVQAFRDRVLKLDPSLISKPDDHSPVPENGDGYKVSEDHKDLALDAVRELAVAQKWTQVQFDGYVAQIAGEQASSTEAQTQWMTDQQTALAEQLGQGKESRINRTVAVLTETQPELAQKIQAGEVDSQIVLALDALVHKMIDMGGEEGQMGIQDDGGSRVMTPSEALGKCTDIRTEMSGMRQSDPRYNLLMAELVKYQGLARAAA
jgi:hypothetical protein